MPTTLHSSAPEESKCPCCGGALIASHLQWIKSAQVVVWNGGSARLSPSEADMFDVLWLARRDGSTIYPERIGDRIYRTCPDRVPLDVRKTVNVLAHTLRRKLAGSGVTVSGDVGKRGGYRLTRIEIVKVKAVNWSDA